MGRGRSEKPISVVDKWVGKRNDGALPLFLRKSLPRTSLSEMLQANIQPGPERQKTPSKYRLRLKKLTRDEWKAVFLATSKQITSDSVNNWNVLCRHLFGKELPPEKYMDLLTSHGIIQPYYLGWVEYLQKKLGL